MLCQYFKGVNEMTCQCNIDLRQNDETGEIRQLIKN